MFDNVGGKIKVLASVFCWIGIAGSCISGLVLMFAVSFLIGLAVGAGGSLLSWAASFPVYGLGQLIENSDTIVRQNERILKAGSDERRSTLPPQSENTDAMHKWRCASCGKMISQEPCPHCGK